jgi:hypothetical protein
VYTFVFTRADRVIWVLWSKDGELRTIHLSNAPLAAWNALGEPITPGNSMQISVEPVFLEWMQYGSSFPPY